MTPRPEFDAADPAADRTADRTVDRTVQASPADSVLQAANQAAYGRMALQLHHDLPAVAGKRTVMLTCANNAPLAAYASICLAHSLAEELQRSVVLVDAHARAGDVSRLLGCSAALGFSDMLLDPMLHPGALMQATSHPLVSVLPAGVAAGLRRPRAPADIERVLRAIADGPEFVLLHAGPVLDDTAALSLAPFVARVLLLAFENDTLLGDLDLAQRALRACKAQQIGLVIASNGASR